MTASDHHLKRTDRIPLLLLVRRYTDRLSYLDDWEDALVEHPGFDVTVEDIADVEGHFRIAKAIETAPYIVLHHSVNGDGCALLTALIAAFESRRGRLISFVGNEVNLPLAPMSEKLTFFEAVRPDLILTQLLVEAGQWLYEPVGTRVEALPHALNPSAFKPGPPSTRRRIDVGVRAVRYSPHLGDFERLDLFKKFQDLVVQGRIVGDLEIGGVRFNRAGWAEFLSTCRATISSEAGSYWLERDDRLCLAMQRALRGSAGMRIVLPQSGGLRALARRFLPASLRKAIVKASPDRFIEDYNLGIGDDSDSPAIRRAQAKIFRHENRAPVYTKCISSRHFDAIGATCVQILIAGRYNEILVPGEHYIPLRPDLADMEEALRQLDDRALCDAIAQRAYAHVMSSHTFPHRMSRFELLVRSL